MFYNRANRPESKTMRMFRPVRQVAGEGRSTYPYPSATGLTMASEALQH